MKKPKTILWIGSFLSRHGLSPAVSEELSVRLEIKGWNALRTSSRLNPALRYFSVLKTIFGKRHTFSLAHIDVFSGRAFFLAESAAWLLRWLRKPYLMTLHGGNLPSFSEKYPKRVHALLESAKAVVAPSNYLLNEMKKYSKNIKLIPNGIDISNYAFKERAMASAKLIWLRAFDETYNPSLAVEVIAIVKKQFPQITLTMIGPDKKDGSLQRTKALIEKRELNSNVRIIEGIPKKEVPHYLNQADIFINTTNIDNTPVSVLEALACGLCVVSTDVGGIPHLLEHSQNAILVPSHHAAKMAEVVTEIINKPELAKRISVNARRKAETFDWTPVLSQWEHLLESVSGRA